MVKNWEYIKEELQYYLAHICYLIREFLSDINNMLWNILYKRALELGQKHRKENPYCITSVGTLEDYDRINRMKHYGAYIPFWKVWRVWKAWYKF
jgi:hypothetical protein